MSSATSSTAERAREYGIRAATTAGKKTKNTLTYLLPTQSFILVVVITFGFLKLFGVLDTFSCPSGVDGGSCIRFTESTGKSCKDERCLLIASLAISYGGLMLILSLIVKHLNKIGKGGVALRGIIIGIILALSLTIITFLSIDMNRIIKENEGSSPVDNVLTELGLDAATSATGTESQPKQTLAYHIIGLVIVCLPIILGIIALFFACKGNIKGERDSSRQFKSMCFLEGFFHPITYFTNRDKREAVEYTRPWDPTGDDITTKIEDQYKSREYVDYDYLEQLRQDERAKLRARAEDFPGEVGTSVRAAAAARVAREASRVSSSRPTRSPPPIPVTSVGSSRESRPIRVGIGTSFASESLDTSDIRSPRPRGGGGAASEDPAARLAWREGS